ncbi:MAG: hypothetical protein RLY31_981 [Bacteroidota bacterium]|jgi:cytochrome c-type biogenesis protein CcmF
MEEIQYIGELHWPGMLGHLSVVTAFVSSLFAAASYFLAVREQEPADRVPWLRLGRMGFTLHSASVLSVIGTLFFLLVEKRYEYAYAQKVISDDLPFKYIFSAFWQEQEGSFLLWAFWHVVLGLVLMGTARRWEAPVLSLLSLVQAFILSMLLGVYLTDTFKIGSNPFLLLRDTLDIPLFSNADYVSLLKGNGLNPLLQNYWMTIHPPTLFLGFASTVVPFCFALAGLWTGAYKEWMRPALPWALFSGAILGTGILMGGAWAYEALSFGGYWAWDPVENTSLVPWITLVAGIHTHLVARHTGRALRSTLFLYILTFLLVLYSTFLTRSGVLGSTSVHAFTEMGLENQLLLFICTFALLSFGNLVRRYRQIPTVGQEEALASREFWMMVGSLVLLFSAVLLTISTSIPVFNKIVALFRPDFAGFTLTDPVAHHNDFQTFPAIFIGLLSGTGLLLRYQESRWSSRRPVFLTMTGWLVLASAGFTALLSLWIDFFHFRNTLVAFAGIFGVLANVYFLASMKRGKSAHLGSVLSHVGFGLMLVGVIASGLNKRNISHNPMVQAGLLDEEMVRRNVLLFKNSPLYMNGYRVTYRSDTLVGNLRSFRVDYEELDEAGRRVDSFTVNPSAVYNNEVTEVVAYNPDTRRYIDKDIFTHIATLPRKEADFKFAQEEETKLRYDLFDVGISPVYVLDTVVTGPGDSTLLGTEVFLAGLSYRPSHPDYEEQAGDFAVGVTLGFRKDDTVHYATPVIYLRDKLWGSLPVQLNELSMKVRLPETALFNLLEKEEQLRYASHDFTAGMTIRQDSMDITFTGINKTPAVQTMEGDVAIGALFEVRHAADPGRMETLEPIFLIRDGRIVPSKDAGPASGIHLYLSKIDPATETFTAMVATESTASSATFNLPVEIARKSYRTDYIVLEAILFPGINFFWLGTILMMVGLTVGMVLRIRQRGMPSGSTSPGMIPPST